MVSDELSDKRHKKKGAEENPLHLLISALKDQRA
jgi:hypothetical protein